MKARTVIPTALTALLPTPIAAQSWEVTPMACHKRTFKTALMFLSLAVLLTACQRRSIIEDLVGHAIIISDNMGETVETTGNGGWIPEPKTQYVEIRYEAHGKSVVRRIEITNEELSINGKAFGRMEPRVRIEIEGQRVLLNSKELRNSSKRRAHNELETLCHAS